MAEIEHFVDPETSKAHERFSEITDLELPFLKKSTQLSGKTTTTTMTIHDAVKVKKIVDNETLGYFLGRIYLFLIKIGADQKKIRFRQHLDNEMAHYACDCWDVELLTSYGWIECVGCADRSAYDLSVHSKATGVALVVKEPRAEPVRVEEWQATLQKKLLGPMFTKDAKKIENAVAALDQSDLFKLAKELSEKAVISIPITDLSNGKPTVELSRDICTIERTTRIEHIREYTPNVIEPSFGIGRILYSVLEHVYWRRPGDTARGVSQISGTRWLSLTLGFRFSLSPSW